MSGRARPDEPLAFVCEAVTRACLGESPSERHHRLRRSQGGGDERANTLDCCGRCHNWIHGHPTESYRMGWMIRSNHTPTKGVLYQRGNR